MFGSIRHSHGPKPVPVIPPGAVIQTGQGAVVYRERGKGVFERTAVTVGTPRDGYVPVLSGLRAGERVVAEGGVLLRGN
jgi:multidrug efflux pump subunit AcrA (membrane-fusion protein)